MKHNIKLVKYDNKLVELYWADIIKKNWIHGGHGIDIDIDKDIDIDIYIYRYIYIYIYISISI